MKKVAVFVAGIFSGLLFFSFTTVGLAGGSFFIDDVTSFVGIGNTTPASRLDVNGAMYSRLVTASSTTIDWNAANVQTMTLSSSPTLTFSNGHAGGEYTLILNQDSTGGRSVTWPASVIWSEGDRPSLTTDASAIDMVKFVYNGTNYLASYKLNYSAAPGIQFDQSASGGAGNNSFSFNASTAGNDRLLFVYVTGGINGSEPSSVTYNGASMTKAGSVFNSQRRSSVWYLLNPALGTHSVSIICADDCYANAASYKNVNQSIGVDAIATSSGTGVTTLTTNLSTSYANEWVVLAGRGFNVNNIAGTNSTLREASINGEPNWYEYTSNPAASAGSVSMTITPSSGSDNMGAIMVSFVPKN